MKNSLFLAVLAVLAAGVSADQSIDLTANGDAADSASVRTKYYAKVSSDASTKTTLSVTSGVLRVGVTWGSTGSYGSNAVLMLPFNSSWTTADFSNVTAITFSYRTDTGTEAEFACNSDLWKGTGSGIIRTAVLPATGGSFKTATISPTKDLVWLAWMTKDTTQSWSDVMAAIKNLQFQPMPENTSAGTVLSSHKTAYLEVANITLVGGTSSESGNFWEPAGTSACAGKSLSLSDGSKISPVLGTYWYDFADTTSGTADSSNGTTAFADTLLSDGTNLGFTATLSRAAWQIYGGWADLGLGLSADGGVLAATGLTGISFDLQMGDAGGASFDTNKIKGIYFKVSKKSVNDAEPFQIGLSYAKHSASGNVCVATTDLRQPAWYTKTKGTTSFSASDLTRLAWEMKIEDQNASVTSATASQFWIGNVKLWGVDSTITADTTPVLSSFKASKKSAMLTSKYTDTVTFSGTFDKIATCSLIVRGATSGIVWKKLNFSAQKSFSVAWPVGSKSAGQTSSFTSGERAVATLTWAGSEKASRVAKDSVLLCSDSSCLADTVADTGTTGLVRTATAGFSVRYAQGLVLNYALEGGTEARIDVLRLDGSRVASFVRPETVAHELRLPAFLAQGTYLVRIRGGRTVLALPLSVLR